MIYAYLFINLNTDQDNDNILDLVKDLPHVKEAYRLYGTYDMVLILEVESTNHLKEVTLQSVRRLINVESTVTFLALESYFKPKN